MRYQAFREPSKTAAKKWSVEVETWLVEVETRSVEVEKVR